MDFKDNAVSLAFDEMLLRGKEPKETSLVSTKRCVEYNEREVIAQRNRFNTLIAIVEDNLLSDDYNLSCMSGVMGRWFNDKFYEDKYLFMKRTKDNKLKVCVHIRDKNFELILQNGVFVCTDPNVETGLEDRVLDVFILAYDLCGFGYLKEC